MNQTESNDDETKVQVRLMAELEREIDQVLKAREGGKRLTLTEIEDVVLAARQRLGETITETLVQAQEQEARAEVPISSASHRPLVCKGKKTRPSKRG